MTNCDWKELGEFKVAKYNSKQIVLINTKTKILYDYYQITKSYEQAINNDVLLLPIVSQNILLYPKMKSNLEIEIKNRRNSFKKQLYSEEQLIETFVPILNCLRDMHFHKITYKKLDKTCILVSNEGEIKLQDWNIYKGNSNYYFLKDTELITFSDDIKALGLIIVESAILQSQQNVLKSCQDQLLKKVSKFYSKNFILAIIIMIYKVQKHFDDVKILLTDKNYVLSEQNLQIKRIYEKLTQNPQQIKCKDYLSEDKKVLVRKNNVDSLKLQKKEIPLAEKDKQMFLMRKNQIDKVHKIIERSSVFVNELITKRVQQLKKNSPFMPINRGLQNEEVKKISKYEYSPYKNIRMISRKR